MNSPGFSVGRTERVTIRDGLDPLADGSLGIPAGSILGPLAWGAAYERSDDATYASPQYGTLGVLEHTTSNGEAGTLRIDGRTRARVSEPVQLGQLLTLDPANPGQLHGDTTGTAFPVARAAEAGDGLVTVRLLNLPIIQPDASGA